MIDFNNTKIVDNQFYNLNYESLKLKNKILSSNINGFVGAKINLYPHQFYIAIETCKRIYPRVLLADEVGLGKTIEAGLIINKLLLSKRFERILIVTPENLQNQWKIELEKKFNLKFKIIDSDSDHFSENQLVISNLPFLLKNEDESISAQWDLLIVDEAHHISWSEEFVSPEYNLIQEISDRTDGLLLLTATPEQLGLESHFARLHLIDPDRFFDLHTFIRETAEYSQITESIKALINKLPINERQENILLKSCNDSKLIENKLKYIERGSEKDREELIEMLVDQHGTGRVIFRNTRQTVNWQTKRIIKPFKLENNPNAKKEWLIKTLKKNDLEKVFLICNSKEEVKEINQFLEKTVDKKIWQFHEGLTQLERDKNAKLFNQNDNDILLCSEIGGEGRNFQSAKNLILYDLPLNTDLIEQRIGRLDRIGQKGNINIYIPYLANTEEQIIFEILHNGLNAFETYAKGGNSILKRYENRITKACTIIDEMLANDSEILNILIEEIQEYKLDLYFKLEKNKDTLLEYNSFRPKIGNEIIRDIKKNNQDLDLEFFIKNSLSYYQINYQEIEDLIYQISNNHIFKNIPETVQFTFNREKALSQDNLVFMTQEHPLVLEMIEKIRTNKLINILVQNNSESQKKIEFIYLLKGEARREIELDRYLAETPIKIIIDNDDLKDYKSKEILENKNLQNQIKASLKQANLLAEEEVSKIKKISIDKMQKELSFEKNRLIELQKVNPNINDFEIEFIDEKINIISDKIKEASLNINSLKIYL